MPEGVFTDTGHFVDIPGIWRRFEVPDGGKHRTADIWQDRVSDVLLDARPFRLTDFSLQLPTGATTSAPHASTAPIPWSRPATRDIVRKSLSVPDCPAPYHGMIRNLYDTSVL
jgi:hypothetical protein